MQIFTAKQKILRMNLKETLGSVSVQVLWELISLNATGVCLGLLMVLELAILFTLTGFFAIHEIW